MFTVVFLLSGCKGDPFLQQPAQNTLGAETRDILAVVEDKGICASREGGHIGKIDDQIFGAGEKQVKVCLKKSEISVTDQYGNICGTVSYTSPYLSLGLDNTLRQESIDEINGYFREELDEFWGREDTGELLVKAQSYAQCGTQNIPIFSSEVDTQIVQAGDGIFSIRQVQHWYAGGTISDLECGATFSLYTGRRLALDEFIDCSLEDFCVQIVDFLYDGICDSGRIPVSKEELSIRCDASTLDSYNFFVYEGDVYIPIPSVSSSEADMVVCWSIAQQTPTQLFLGRTSTSG